MTNQGHGWPAWLGPEPAPTENTNTALLAVGGDRPVVRVPDALGLPALARLLDRDDDRAMVGPVLHHRLSQVTYWWVRPGSTGSYPPGCRLLAADTALVVPGPRTDYRSVASWLHMPERPILSGPAWLAAALHAERTNPRLTDPQSGETMSETLPIESAASPADEERELLMYRASLGKLRPADFQRLDELGRETATEARGRAS